MALKEDSTSGFSRTVLIIKRSMCCYYDGNSQITFLGCRVLIAGIRSLGKHPCPRCLVPLDSVHDLGTEQDMRWRIEHARHDDSDYRETLATARSNLYDKRYALDGEYVKGLLGGLSLAAAEVSYRLPR